MYAPQFDLYFAQNCPTLQARCALGLEPQQAERHCDSCSQNDICVQLLAYNGDRSAVMWLANNTSPAV